MREGQKRVGEFTVKAVYCQLFPVQIFSPSFSLFCLSFIVSPSQFYAILDYFCYLYNFVARKRLGTGLHRYLQLAAASIPTTNIKQTGLPVDLASVNFQYMKISLNREPKWIQCRRQRSLFGDAKDI